MNNNLDEAVRNRQEPWHGTTLGQYVTHRNGVPLGDSKSLRNMLRRSFGAGSFAGFWQYWNPIWGYGLGRFVYSPLKRVLPRALAVIMTFAISGGIHDLATMAVRRSPAFLFTPWFFLLGAGVVLGRLTRLDYSDHPWGVRAGINLAYVAIGLVVTLIVKRLLPIP